MTLSLFFSYFLLVSRHTALTSVLSLAVLLYNLTRYWVVQTITTFSQAIPAYHHEIDGSKNYRRIDSFSTEMQNIMRRESCSGNQIILFTFENSMKIYGEPLNNGAS